MATASPVEIMIALLQQVTSTTTEKNFRFNCWNATCDMLITDDNGDEYLASLSITKAQPDDEEDSP